MTALTVPTKQCSSCKRVQELSEFDKDPRYKGGHVNRCRTCKNAQKRARRKVYTEEQQHKERVRQRAYRYGISVEEVERLSNSPCHMCGRPDSGVKDKAMHIDHCHETGKVRGALCHQCNIYVGWREKNRHLESAYETYMNGAYA